MASGLPPHDVHASMHLQLLGNGHRAYNSLLMRFHSPDLLSPFGRGGINAYVYCGGDPVNRTDPAGRFFQWIAMGTGGATLATLLGATAFRLAGDKATSNVLVKVATGLAGATLVFLPTAAVAGPGRMKSPMRVAQFDGGAGLFPQRPQARNVGGLHPESPGQHHLAEPPDLVQGLVVGRFSARPGRFRAARAPQAMSPQPAMGKRVTFSKQVDVFRFETWSSSSSSSSSSSKQRIGDVRAPIDDSSAEPDAS